MSNLALPRKRVVATLFVVLVLAVAFLVCRVERQNAQGRTSENRGSPLGKFAAADALTDKIRNRGREIVRVAVESDSDRKRVAKIGEIIQDFGSFMIISKSKSQRSASGLRIDRINAFIRLPGKVFDPIAEPQLSSAPMASLGEADAPGYYIAQFGGVATDEWLASLRDAGVEVIQYVPDGAFLVYGNGAAISKASANSRIRWLGKYLSEHKLPSGLRTEISERLSGKARPVERPSIELTSDDTAIFDVSVFRRANLQQTALRIAQETGGTVKSLIELPSNFFNVARVEVQLRNVEAIANIEDVIRIDAWSRPVREDERAAQIVAGNYLSTTALVGPGYNPLAQFGVDGRNVTVSVVDDGISIPGNGGFYITSANTVDGPLRGASPGATGSHGHLNATIIAGAAPFGMLDQANYNYGLGVAPKSNVINIPLLTSSYSGSEADTYNDTVSTLGPNGVRGSISNNSWGNGLNGNAYDSYTAQFDGFVRDASAAPTIDPLLLIFSAGNSGPNAPSLTRPKAAKNLIAVGNAENLRTEFGGANADNIDDLRGTSSRGPTADGRVKPDIIAPGSYITGGRAGDCSSVTNCFDVNHVYSVGTSHAAPQVAGAAALFTEFWKNQNAGQNPSPALVKAAIINSGREMAGANTNTATVPNGNEGWGRVNLKSVLSTGVPMKYVNETTTFSNVGETYAYSGTLADAAKPLRISLVWTDPPGLTDPALVNNLDLRVTVGGTVYRGNVFSGGNSTAGGSADTVNNVENVWLPAGVAASTPIQIEVTAAAINGDGVLGNSDLTDQNFALVAYNVSDAETPRPEVRSDFDGDGKSDIAVWRPSSGVWYVIRSSDATATVYNFGLASDIITPGDFDGDGKTDSAVFRPSNGVWYVARSSGGFSFVQFGQSGDVPVAGDYDGDGTIDFAVWRPSTGVWYLLRSTAGFGTTVFGLPDDKPVQGDFDGDGKTDVAVYRPSNGMWYINRSTSGIAYVNFGLGDDRPVQSDFDGDGKTDVAVYRPTTGVWYELQSSAGFNALNFGLASDVPTPADFDGDSIADVSVFRGSEGNWYLLQSRSGFNVTRFGLAGDIPVQAGYLWQGL